MTIQEFANAHPQIVGIDRAGLAGIDLSTLSAKIRQSRFLTETKWFPWFTQNYNEILAGKYDDFPARVKPKPADALQEQQRRRAEEKQALLIALEKLKRLKISDDVNSLMKQETGVTREQCIELLEDANMSEHSFNFAKQFYNRVRTFWTDYKAGKFN